jgi:FtsP/CotA-like multicopper oxidase with cupredoxin domain
VLSVTNVSIRAACSSVNGTPESYEKPRVERSGLVTKLVRPVVTALSAILLLIGGVVLIAFLYASTRGVDYVNERVTLGHRLAIPPLLAPQMENGEKVFVLTALKGRTELLPGKYADTAGFNGTILGPTIRAHQGDRVRLHVTNDLGEATTVHWHGMHLPAAMDGGPHQLIPPGAVWSPHWVIKNEAATLWYHPHTAGKTAVQVYSGLAGLFIIDDDRSDALALPKTYGVDDIPLVVQDRNFDAGGQLAYRRDRTQQNFGEMGDAILVNGAYAPYVEVPKKLVRFRILNGSNARRYNFGFSDNRSFDQIATDGGLLDAPVKRTRMVLAPGERAEIIVDMSSARQPVTLMSYAVPGAGKMFHLVSNLLPAGRNDEYQQFKILELRSRPGAASHEAAPTKLNTIVRLQEKDAVRTSVFRLTDRMSINGQPMDHRRIDQIVRKGDTEIWEIRDEEALFYHAFHVHDVQFQILDRDGKPAADYERGWKDTVLLNPRETVRVIARFDDYSDPHLPYMFHCHILEHEDMGMMGQFVVVDRLTDKVGVVSPLTQMEDSRHSHAHNVGRKAHPGPN